LTIDTKTFAQFKEKHCPFWECDQLLRRNERRLLHMDVCIWWWTVARRQHWRERQVCQV